MLPPFVPPSARGNREALPSITEFVTAPQERSFSQTASAVAEPPTPPLPEITEFLAEQQRPPEKESRPSEGGWLDDERNAFDWQAVSMLAIRQNEERRAEEEWTATSWDQANASAADHVAAMLMQVARRIRGGDLRVEGMPDMSPEAALAVTLVALLQSNPR